MSDDSIPVHPPLAQSSETIQAPIAHILREAFPALEGLLEEKQTLATRLHAITEEIIIWGEEVLAAIGRSPYCREMDINAFVDFVYWHEIIPSTVLAQRLIGCTNNALMRRITPQPSGVVCSQCQQPLLATSLQNKREIQRSGRTIPEYISCEPCREKSVTAILAERDREASVVDERLQQLRTMRYVEYLRTPEWQATRDKALWRARYQCQVCHGKGKLNVHHRTYFRRGAEEPQDLTVLCAECHQLFHREGKLASPEPLEGDSHG